MEVGIRFEATLSSICRCCRHRNMLWPAQETGRAPWAQPLRWTCRSVDAACSDHRPCRPLAACCGQHQEQRSLPGLGDAFLPPGSKTHFSPSTVPLHFRPMATGTRKLKLKLSVPFSISFLLKGFCLRSLRSNLRRRPAYKPGSTKRSKPPACSHFGSGTSRNRDEDAAMKLPWWNCHVLQPLLASIR